MPFDDSSVEAAPGDSRPQMTPGESLTAEIRAAADAAAAEMRKITATASAEARLSASSAIAMASVTMLGVALLIVAWTFVVALGVWLVIEAGWSVAAALLSAALANIAAAGVCRLWYGRLSKNVGFSRTLGLLLGGRPRYGDSN